MSGAITAATIAGVAGSVGGGVIGAVGANKAASTQASAAEQAAQLQAQASQNALDFQKQQYGNTQANEAPYLAAGASGLNALQYGLGTGGTANGSGVGQGSLLTPYGPQFSAPTGLTEQNDPGYQARLQLGTDALQKSAAARGGVLTGGTARDLNTYAQDYASNEYGNVYNRALNTYDTNANNYYTGQANQYNRLAGTAQSGQNAAATLAGAGQAASNNVTSNLLGTAQQIGQQTNNAGAATASGYVGGGNAISNGLSGAGNNISNLALLNSMSGYGGAGANAGITGPISTGPLNQANY